MSKHRRSLASANAWRLMLAILVVAACYWPGLYGGWLFDDYPNIVDNKGVQPPTAAFASLVNAMLSSPASEFKRPLASLSFAANYLATGLDPYWMKLTNLLIHLLNGMLVFQLTRSLLPYALPKRGTAASITIGTDAAPSNSAPAREESSRTPWIALYIAVAWMLLPINLTGVLYVVQRMESLANLFVLAGLIGYIRGRQLMLETPRAAAFSPAFVTCLVSATIPAIVGSLSKETAAMLPLYALLVEWSLFGFRLRAVDPSDTPKADRWDWRIITLFILVIVLPLAFGTHYLLPQLLQPQAWAARDFTMGTRLLSEARIVVSYIWWTIAPTPGALSFYHDDFTISTGPLVPWTTLASMACLASLIGLAIWQRPKRPLIALGLTFFLAGHILTATVLPLELVYEHRNYFPSYGLLLAIVPILTIHYKTPQRQVHHQQALLGLVVLGALLIWWTGQTAITAFAWSDPLRLSRELAARDEDSPRAQYELGRTYIIYSHYDPASPYTRLAYQSLEVAASLPASSILPEQALIFMNSHMQLPLKEQWWNSMIAKLSMKKPGIQDESALIALTKCAREGLCRLPAIRMKSAFQAAISHQNPSARLQAAYGDYAWNVLGERTLGECLTAAAVEAAPTEPAYRITLVGMLLAQGRTEDAASALGKLEKLNVGGRLDDRLPELHRLLDAGSH